MDKQIIVIGGGVVGCAVARLLSRYEAAVTVLEGGEDVAHGASKANSGIVHAGFDAAPGFPEGQAECGGLRDISGPVRGGGRALQPSRGHGAGLQRGRRRTIQTLYEQGVKNGVEAQRNHRKGCKSFSWTQHPIPEVSAALLEPMSGLTSPYELTCALADHAAVNGAEFRMNTRVEKIEKAGKGFRLITNQGVFEADLIVNCAGVHSAELHNQMSEKKLNIIARKGEYYLLDHQLPLLFEHTMFQCPTAMGKGVLVSPTVHGNTLLGPSAEDVPDTEDVSTTAGR